MNQNQQPLLHVIASPLHVQGQFLALARHSSSQSVGIKNLPFFLEVLLVDGIVVKDFPLDHHLVGVLNFHRSNSYWNAIWASPTLVVLPHYPGNANVDRDFLDELVPHILRVLLLLVSEVVPLFFLFVKKKGRKRDSFEELIKSMKLFLYLPLLFFELIPQTRSILFILLSP